MKILLRGFVIEDIEGEPPCARLLGELSNTRLERLRPLPDFIQTKIHIARRLTRFLGRS